MAKTNYIPNNKTVDNHEMNKNISKNPIFKVFAFSYFPPKKLKKYS